jgi:argininosuccinate lyase
VDLALAAHDCRASAVHARLLERAGVISRAEADKLTRALERLRAEAENGQFVITEEDEDGHSAIERRLTEDLGDVGKKIHTARSRNDQVVTALRLYMKDRLDAVSSGVSRLREALARRIAADGHVPLPGYTHMRKAMPSSVGLWLGALDESLEDDLVALAAARVLVNRSPMGTGAGYGIPVIELDRELGARELGFAGVQRNPLYVQNGRGKLEAFAVAGLAGVMAGLNRFASDVILFSMEEFGFLRLPTEMCTGSSIMPHKLNPDVLELMRARSHEVVGCEIQLRSIGSSLVSGYNRDVQRMKRPLVESFELTEPSLSMAAAVVERLEVDPVAAAAAMTEDLQATRRVYELVQRGVPFRDAYRTIAAELFPGE